MYDVFYLADWGKCRDYLGFIIFVSYVKFGLQRS
jgi:hypothetical protein